MKYSDAFDIIERNNLNGYIIISNSDIFFDNTLINLYKSSLSTNKNVYCQLRFEYSNKDLKSY